MKLAFVGFGAQTRENLLPACGTILDLEVAAICDNNAQKCNEAVDIFGRDKVFTSHRKMMDTVKPDAVITACYPRDHYQIAIDAIERGIPVFIEKPLAPSTAHVKTLIDLAEKRQVTTGLGMNFRFAEVTQRLAAIADGHFNTITLRQLANKPVDPLWDYRSLLRSFLHAQTIHGIDMLIHLCGPIRDLHVVNNNHGSRIVFTVMMEFESGAHGSLITSNTSPHFVFDFDAICRDTVCVSSRALWDISVTEIDKTYAGEERKKWRDSWAPSPLVSGFERSGYRGQIEDFIASIRQGRVQSATSFSTILETYRCLDMIEERCLKDQSLKVNLVS